MKYCAFLRGVNVNGTAMKMAEVCDVFKKAGMKDVSSVLATGNILFESDEAPENLKQKYLIPLCKGEKLGYNR